MWKSSKHQYASFKHFSFSAFDSFTDKQVLPTYETNSKTLNWFLGKKEKVFCYQEMFLLIHFLSRSVFFGCCRQSKQSINEMKWSKKLSKQFSPMRNSQKLLNVCVCVWERERARGWFYFFSCDICSLEKENGGCHFCPIRMLELAKICLKFVRYKQALENKHPNSRES